MYENYLQSPLHKLLSCHIILECTNKKLHKFLERHTWTDSHKIFTPVNKSTATLSQYHSTYLDLKAYSIHDNMQNYKFSYTVNKCALLKYNHV